MHYLNDHDANPHLFRVYRYQAWPDFGVPEQPMTLLRLLNNIRHEVRPSLSLLLDSYR